MNLLLIGILDVVFEFSVLRNVLLIVLLEKLLNPTFESELILKFFCTIYIYKNCMHIIINKIHIYMCIKLYKTIILYNNILQF